MNKTADTRRYQLVHLHLLPRTAIAVGERENVTFGVHLDRCVVSRRRLLGAGVEVVG